MEDMKELFEGPRYYNKADGLKRIEIALRCPKKLTLLEYVEETKFDGLDAIAKGRLLMNLNDDILVYIDEPILQWCGYSGELKTKKLGLMKILKASGIPYVQLNNVEYANFLKGIKTIPNGQWDPLSGNPLFPSLPENMKGRGHMTHILMHPDDFGMLVMRISTIRGDEVRKYFITLQHLIKEYVQYQLEYERRIALYKDETIETLNMKMNQMHLDTRAVLAENRIQTEMIGELREDMTAQNDTLNRVEDALATVVDDRVPLPADESYNEMFVVFRLANYQFDYYVMCLQRKNYPTSRRRLLQRHPNARVVKTIAYQPNSKNMFKRLKEALGTRLTTSVNYININGINHVQFMEQIDFIHMQRLHVDIDT